MGLTLTEKIIKAHIVDGEMKKGTEIGLKIDQTLTQDATGTMAYLQFEAMGVDRVKTERSVAYIDHNTLQSGFENADDHRFIGSIAKKHGISIISMIAPTSEARIKSIAESADGFLYIVSSMGVTGVRSEIKTDLASIMESVKKYKKVPAAIGFGVSTPEQAEKMAALSDGVIVGSAIVRIVEKYGEKAAPEIYNYVKSMTDAVHKI